MSATQLALKRCSKCGDTKPLGQFYKHPGAKDGFKNSCKACYLAQKREYCQTGAGKTAAKRYAQSPEGKAIRKATDARYRAEGRNQIKRQARKAVELAIRKGEMAPPSACQCNDCCKAPAVELHHHSYEPIHWLDVVPLCKACHIYRHANPESF